MDHLKRVINYTNIDLKHILQFCDDHIDQILYINETIS